MLNNRQRKMLRFLYRKGEYNAVKFYKKFKISEDYDEEYEKLVTKKYILLDSSNSSRAKHTVAIIEKGITAEETVQKENFRFWFPTIISIVALIVAILAYIKQ
ncbi:MAG: hypothetical protein J6A61_05870 [Clostridia bacterium]|nr:hypothetical protein [Clostridia bacterium]